METRDLKLEGLKLLSPVIHRDERGFFSETHNQRTLARSGIDAVFVQDNQAFSAVKGVVRGLHFQVPPKAQGKLIRVNRGAILDVVVDIRRSSPTYGKHVSVQLDAVNWHQLWVPPGFAHGYCTLENDTEVLYKVTDYYAPEHESGLRWDDPELAIDWPVTADEAILSERDRQWDAFAHLASLF